MTRTKGVTLGAVALLVLLLALPHAGAAGIPVKPSGCSGSYFDLTSAATSGNDYMDRQTTNTRNCGHLKAGDDTLFNYAFGAKADIVWGDSGHEVITGEDGADQLIGNDGPDTIQGDGADDLIWGDAYDDDLHGGAGDDAVFDGTGNDTVEGGSGFDTWYKCEDGDADTVEGAAFEAVVLVGTACGN